MRTIPLFDAITPVAEVPNGVPVNRPALIRRLKAWETSDTRIVWTLDRLGPSLRDLIQMLDDFKPGGIEFRSLTASIDTETRAGRATLYAALLLAAK